MYVVVAGRASFRLGETTHDAPAGTIVVVRDPEVRRAATAEEPGTTVLAVGGRPGLHAVSAWEWIFAAYGHAGEGRLEQGLAELEDGLEVKPEARARLLYHLACIECRSGRTDDALGHLREAVELEPRLARDAEGDDDFAPIRGEPGFPS